MYNSMIDNFLIIDTNAVYQGQWYVRVDGRGRYLYRPAVWFVQFEVWSRAERSRAHRRRRVRDQGPPGRIRDLPGRAALRRKRKASRAGRPAQQPREEPVVQPVDLAGEGPVGPGR